MGSGAVVFEEGRGRRGSEGMGDDISAPEFENVFGEGESFAAVPSGTEGHFSLSDVGIGEGFAVIGAEGLEADSSGVSTTVPLMEGDFAQFEAFSLEDGHLAPVAVEEDIPGDVAWGSAHGSIAFEGVEAIVKGVIDFALDESAANPESADGIVSDGFGVDAAGDLLVFETGFPRGARVGDDEFLADDEAIDIEGFVFEGDAFTGGSELHQGPGDEDGEEDREEAIAHDGVSLRGGAGGKEGRSSEDPEMSFMVTERESGL